MGESEKTYPPTTNTARIVYILYLAGLVVGITSIIGVILSYVNRDDAPEWLATHYQQQIRTFWIGMLYLIVGIILCFIIIGVFVLIYWLIWMIMRCAKGLKYLSREEAYPNPEGWGF
jgi:uncharacterized membrane protein